MKPIKFDLPLNGKRIATLDQLEENLTPEILESFRSGKLAKWLRVRNLTEQADGVEGLLAGDNEREVQLLKSLYALFGGETDEALLRAAISERKKSLPSAQIDTEMEQLKAELSEAKSNLVTIYLGVVLALMARKKKAISTEEFESWSDQMISDMLPNGDINELKQSEIFEQIEIDEELKELLNNLEELIQLQ
ncbi:MAG: hypothetical protein Q8L68_01020 [Methylococcales bacterium]|nr:hypothetical protein [Methylococcales bacterium]